MSSIIEPIENKLQCGYCTTILSSESALKKHQVTAKYCLTIQGDNRQSFKAFECEYCEYTTRLKYDLNKHMKTCKFKIATDKKIQEDLYTKNLLLEQELVQIKHQRDEYKIEALKPKKITTNNLTFDMKQQFFQQILFPISSVLETLPDEIIRRFSFVHFLRGQEGCAQLLSEIMNENQKTYITDSNTGDVFTFKDDEDNIITDDKARMLIEASKEPLEKTAIREYKNKMDEMEYEDDVTKTNSMKKYKSRLQEIKDLPTESNKFRKKLSENIFVSKDTIKTNKGISGNMDKGYALLERLKPKDINLYITNKRINEELSKLSDEDLNIFLDIKSIINFLVEKFLLVNDRLLYKYNSKEDRFSYYESFNEKMVQKHEKSPDIFRTTFFYSVKCFLLKKKHHESRKYIVDLPEETIREALIEVLIKADI